MFVSASDAPSAILKPLPISRSLAAADARRIESVAQRNYPFGSQLKLELARHLPPDLTISLVETCVTAGVCKLLAGTCPDECRDWALNVSDGIYQEFASASLPFEVLLSGCSWSCWSETVSYKAPTEQNLLPPSATALHDALDQEQNDLFEDMPIATGVWPSWQEAPSWMYSWS